MLLSAFILCSQSCLTLCNPMDYSPLCSSVYGIFQLRILKWIAISLPGDLPNSENKPVSSTLAVKVFTTVSPGRPPYYT